MRYTSVIAGLLAIHPLEGIAEESAQSKIEVEAGAIQTRRFEISGYEQANATNGWKSTDPDLRLEYWLKNDSSWNFGAVLQPLVVKYKDEITSDLNYKGKRIKAGDSAELTYQFHSIRGSANFPILDAPNPLGEVRLGTSLIVRYARLDFSTEQESFRDTNLIAFPLINLETRTPVAEGLSLITRSDFLPSPDQNFFLDGLFDVLFAIRTRLKSGSDLDLGMRLFFGGYDPKAPEDYANRIFYQAAVVRYIW
jgi:hypothetical protein